MTPGAQVALVTLAANLELWTSEETVQVWAYDPLVAGGNAVDDVSGCDVHDPHSAEKRNKLVVDHVLLAAPGGLPEPRPHVFGVDLDELLEGHAGRPRLVREEVPLPLQGFGFALEPSLRRVDCLSVAVGVVEPDEPSAALAVFSDGHG